MPAFTSAFSLAGAGSDMDARATDWLFSDSVLQRCAVKEHDSLTHLVFRKSNVPNIKHDLCTFCIGCQKIISFSLTNIRSLHPKSPFHRECTVRARYDVHHQRDRVDT